MFTGGSISVEIFLALFRGFCYCQPSFSTHSLSCAWEVVWWEFSLLGLNYRRLHGREWIEHCLALWCLHFSEFHSLKALFGYEQLGLCPWSQSWTKRKWVTEWAGVARHSIPVEEGLLWMLCVEHTTPQRVCNGKVTIGFNWIKITRLYVPLQHIFQNLKMSYQWRIWWHLSLFPELTGHFQSLGCLINLGLPSRTVLRLKSYICFINTEYICVCL